MIVVDAALGAIQAGTSLLQGTFAAAPSPSPSPIPAPVLNTDGIVGAITKYVVPILLAFLGVVFISRAGKGEMSKVLTSSAIAIIGLGFIAGAGLLFFFGKNLVELILPAPK